MSYYWCWNDWFWRFGGFWIIYLEYYYIRNLFLLLELEELQGQFFVDKFRDVDIEILNIFIKFIVDRV